MIYSRFFYDIVQCLDVETRFVTGWFAVLRGSEKLKRLIATIIFTVCIVCGSVCAAEDIITPGELATGSDSARQLRIMKMALLMGPTEQNRLEAALELLHFSQPDARQILLEAIGLKENSPAVTAVCRALVTSRVAVREKDDFRYSLLRVVRTSSGLNAQHAAEATLIFEYRDIAEELTEMTVATDQNRQQRLNAIYALSLRPIDKEAVSTIALLLDDDDKVVADAAVGALPYWIPAGMDKPAILRYLRRKSQSELVRDWIDFQEKEVRRLKQETLQWQKLYLAAIDREYEVGEDVLKSQMLLARLQSDQNLVKIWAIEKIKVERLSGSVVLSEDFTPALLALISDSDRRVRLETAKILANMSDRNPAEKLLEQLKVEQYDDVRIAVFESLGEACYFAFLPGSPITLSDQIRTQTLEWAEKFIDDQDLSSAKAGAEVIRKLLEPNVLKKEVARKYLNLVADRYNRAKGEDTLLCAELLHIMVRFCAQGSHREEAARLFRDNFIEGLGDTDNASARHAAVTGLINIDKTGAMNIFKLRSMANDESASVRSLIIELGGEVGRVEDIQWLAPLTVANGEGELAWQSIRAILMRQPVQIVADWAEKLEVSISQNRLRDLLEMTAKKAEAENDQDIFKKINRKLRPMNLQQYLKAADYEKAAELIATHLREIGFNAGDVLIVDIETHLKSTDVDDTQKNRFLAALSNIGQLLPKETRLQWAEQYHAFRKMLEPETDTQPEPK